MPKQSLSDTHKTTCRSVAGRKHRHAYLGDHNRQSRGITRAIRALLESSAEPMTLPEIVERLGRRYRPFSVVSMVEFLDAQCQVSVLRWVRRGGCVCYTLPGKLAAFRQARLLGDINIWPVPDLRAILDDVNEL